MWAPTAVTIHFADETGGSHHITWSNDHHKELVDLLQVIVFELDSKIQAQLEPPPEQTHPSGRRHPGPRRKG